MSVQPVALYWLPGVPGDPNRPPRPAPALMTEDEMLEFLRIDNTRTLRRLRANGSIPFIRYGAFFKYPLMQTVDSAYFREPRPRKSPTQRREEARARLVAHPEYKDIPKAGDIQKQEQ